MEDHPYDGERPNFARFRGVLLIATKEAGSYKAKKEEGGRRATNAWPRIPRPSVAVLHL